MSSYIHLPPTLKNLAKKVFSRMRKGLFTLLPHSDTSLQAFKDSIQSKTQEFFLEIPGYRRWAVHYIGEDGS